MIHLPTTEEIEAINEMSDKNRLVALICNCDMRFKNQSEEIQHHMRVGQLQAIVQSKQRLPINESLFLANGFKKVEGMGDDDYYIYDLTTPPFLGKQRTLTHICFNKLYGYRRAYHLSVENQSLFIFEGDTPTHRGQIINRCEVVVETIQQAEDAINAVGFPFSFSLKGYSPEEKCTGAG